MIKNSDLSILDAINKDKEERGASLGCDPYDIPDIPIFPESTPSDKNISGNKKTKNNSKKKSNNADKSAKSEIRFNLDTETVFRFRIAKLFASKELGSITMLEFIKILLDCYEDMHPNLKKINSK